MKRKHRIMVEVTFPNPINQKVAVHAVREVLESADRDAIIGCSDYLDHKNAYLEHVKVKHGDRVIAAERRK